MLAAFIGGMLAAGSIILVFLLARTAPTEAGRGLWRHIAIIWSLLVLISLIYSTVRSRRVLLLRHASFGLLAASSGFAFVGRAVLEARDLLLSEGAEPSVAESVLLPFLIGLVSLLSAVLWARKDGTLTLGNDGLRCVVGAESWQWAWHELAVFEVRAPIGLAGRMLGRHLVVERSESGKKLILSDVWDTPLDEIAAKLNKYRERALASTRGPS